MSKHKWRRETQRDNPMIKTAADLCKQYGLGTVIIAFIEPNGVERHIAVYSKRQLKQQHREVIETIDKFIELEK